MKKNNFLFNDHYIWISFIILIIFYLSFTKIHSYDFWWLLALGRNFWETKEILSTDIFSFTFPNSFFFYHNKLFNILIYYLYTHGKFISLNIFRFIILITTYLFFYKTINLKKHYKIITIALTILTLFPLTQRLLFRPELISRMLILIFLYILFKDKYKATKLIWLIPILQFIWVNTHAGFIFGMSLMIWGGFVRTVLVWHITWSVNSLTHIFGYRTYQTNEGSRNNPLVTLLTFGEGWHNNHHHDQVSANMRHRWWELDLNFCFIKCLEKLGLAYDVILPKHISATATKVNSETIVS